MTFGAVATADAEGAILAHALLLNGRRLPKGRTLGPDDIAAARAAGIAEIVVARLGPDDVPEDVAAARLGAALAGDGLVALAPVHGRVNLAAEAFGLLELDPAAIHALNRVDPGLTVGTLAPHARVAAGDLVATIKVIPYAVPAAALDAALGRAAPLTLARFRPLVADLVHTRLARQSDKLDAKTARVTADRLAALGSRVAGEASCAHDADALAACLARPTAATLTLVAAASATVDENDVVPQAIRLAGGIVDRVGMPVDPGNLLCLGRIGDRTVIGLPGCARSPKRNGVDLVLERLAAGLPLDADAIAAMGVGGLLAEGDRPEPRRDPVPAATKVGAILLAAGRSSRMGDAHKLLAELDGKPLVAHAADAVAAANLPLLVVLGHRGDAVRAALGSRDATYVDAPDFGAGLSRSLRAGLAAAPADWGAAIVCLADMPRVAPATLAALAAAASGPSAIVVPSCGGKRGNPVLWGRAHFARLRGVEGDVGGKALLGEMEDHVAELPVDDTGIFADVDTPAALDRLRNA